VTVLGIEAFLSLLSPVYRILNPLCGEGCHEVTGCVSIIVEKNTPLTPLKRGIKKTPEIYPLDKEKNLFKNK